MRKNPMIVVLAVGGLAVIAILLTMVNGGLLKSQVSQSNGHCEQLETQLSELNQAGFRIRGELNTNTTNQRNKQTEINELELRKTSLSGQARADMQQDIDNLHYELEGLESARVALEVQLAQNSEQIDALSSEINECRRPSPSSLENRLSLISSAYGNCEALSILYRDLFQYKTNLTTEISQLIREQSQARTNGFEQEVSELEASIRVKLELRETVETDIRLISEQTDCPDVAEAARTGQDPRTFYPNPSDPATPHIVIDPYDCRIIRQEYQDNLDLRYQKQLETRNLTNEQLNKRTEAARLETIIRGLADSEEKEQLQARLDSLDQRLLELEAAVEALQEQIEYLDEQIRLFSTQTRCPNLEEIVSIDTPTPAIDTPLEITTASPSPLESEAFVQVETSPEPPENHWYNFFLPDSSPEPAEGAV